MEMPNSITNWLYELSDSDKAELAGNLLDDVDPTYENLKLFWAQLSESCKSELSLRIQDEDL